MLLIRLWNYLSGYVIIKITGEYVERLLNHAALRNIFLWDIKRIDDNQLYAKIKVKDFFKLAPLARKSGCRIYIIQRAGLFFVMLKLKKRKIFVIGALLFVTGIYLMSSFIWSIEVKCLNEELKNSVMGTLRQWGLKEGTFKYGIDREQYINRLLDKYNNITWAEMEIRGSRLILEVVEKQLPPELEENIPCDIIASKDGIIEEITTLRGQALVKPGQTVGKGDVLITGKILLPNDEQLLVHAEGIVKARVWYQKAVKVPLVEIKRAPTGSAKKSIVVQAGKHVLNLHLGDVSYNDYDRRTLKEFNILPESLGGLKFSIVENIQVEMTKEFLGVEEAVRRAEEMLAEQLIEISKENIVRQKRMEFHISSDESAVIGSMIIEVVEEIGQKREVNNGEEKF